MASSLNFAIIAAVIAAVCGQTLVVTNSSQDYFRLSQRELLHDIAFAELRVAAIDDRYADRLNVIQYDQEQVLNEIQQVNQTLMPLQALSLVRKHCIQKYDSQLITYDNAKLRLKTCYDKAEIVGKTLTANAKSTITSTRFYVLTVFPKNVASCNSIANNPPKVEECYMSYVEMAQITVRTDLKTTQDQMDKSLYDASIATRAAVECSFQVERDILQTIATTKKQIDDCEQALKEKSTNAVDGKKNVQSLIMGKADGV